MNDQKNLLIAIVASIAIYVGFDYFYTGKNSIPQNQILSQSGSVSSFQEESKKVLTRAEALKEDDRIVINTPRLKGSIRLKGAMLDDVELKNYKETTNENSPNVFLLTPKKAEAGYTASFDWTGQAEDCPNENTHWKIINLEKNAELTPNTPLKLTYDNKKGLVFERTISVDNDYLFTITDKVINTGSKEIELQNVGSVKRYGKPNTSDFFVLHEGAVGILNKSLTEVSYGKAKDRNQVVQTTTGGWIGFTDKYWLVALVPSQTTPILCSYDDLSSPAYNSILSDEENNKRKIYKTNISTSKFVIGAGKSIETTQNLFVGAKELALLDKYRTDNGFDRFDLAVDFGWFYFVTKPLFYILNFFHNILGNFGLAILLLTILFKVALFPLANKSHRSMARMKDLQPKMEKLKTLYTNDKVKLNQEMMNLYKNEKVNPMSGCLPMIIQAPIFFCLYKVFFVTIEMRHAPFFGWIHDLSAIDPTTAFNLFGLIPWTPPSFLMIGAWPLIMGATMVLQQRLGPQPSDPQQAKVMMIMPVMFTYMFASFPTGLVIYWAWSNLLTILQQLFINYRHDSRKKNQSTSKKNKK